MLVKRIQNACGAFVVPPSGGLAHETKPSYPPPENSLRQNDTPLRPAPIKTLLLKTTALTAIVVASMCGCTKSPKSFDQISEEEQLNYLRAQAGSAMLAQATNGVPNIHDIIDENADTFSGSVEQWRGWVRLDYTDTSGGLQQTNVPMAFAATYDGHLVGREPGHIESTLNDIINN